MLDVIAVNVGEFFAEVDWRTPQSDGSSKKRWFLGKKSLNDGLRELLKEREAGGVIELSPSPALFFAPLRKTPGELAFLTTSGFEHWLQMRTNLSAGSAKVVAPYESDFCFGIDERIDASGVVVQALSEADLAPIDAKLKLSGVKQIAVGFLHAQKNPAHEKHVAHYFGELGYKVILSSETPPVSSEIERWQNGLSLSARMQKLFSAQSAVQSLVDENFKSWKLKSPEKSAGATKASSGTGILHLELESFWIESQGTMLPLEICATSLLKPGFFGCPEFSGESSGYEPGPMVLGKSFVPSLVDFLYVSGELTQVEGFSEHVQERSKPRILEAILAMIRSHSDVKHLDMQATLAQIESALASQLWLEIVSQADIHELHLTGALAPSFTTLLRKYRPSGISIKGAK